MDEITAAADLRKVHVKKCVSCNRTPTPIGMDVVCNAGDGVREGVGGVRRRMHERACAEYDTT